MSTVIESKVPFAKSQIWEWQRAYFEEMGFEAWRQGEVPHYVTTNQRQAHAYAEVLLALRKDYAHLPAPIHIIEMGAGSGKFAFFVLKRLQELCDWEGLDLGGFRYVLTDFTQSNLDFWKLHPRFQSYFQSGILDIALLDATAPKSLALQLGGGRIGWGDLDAPVVCIANYLFDTIPQDLLYLGKDGLQLCLSTLSIPESCKNASSGEKLANAALEYSLAAPQYRYPESTLNATLRPFRKAEKEKFMLFPAIGIRCLAFLKSLSRTGLLLLTADKGSHLLHKCLLAGPPHLAAHGSFSLSVNYHALGLWATLQGGESHFPEHPTGGIHTGCIHLLGPEVPKMHLKAAIHRHILELGPDSYYTNYRFLRAQVEDMSLEDALSALRLSLFDCHQLALFAKAILKGLPKATAEERAEILKTLDRCWDNYYALAEDRDMPLLLGSICYELDAYEAAILFFLQSEDIYGAYSGMHYNIAVCYYMLGNVEEALKFLEVVRQHDRRNLAAEKMYMELVAGKGENA